MPEEAAKLLNASAPAFRCRHEDRFCRWPARCVKIALTRRAPAYNGVGIYLGLCHRPTFLHYRRKIQIAGTALVACVELSGCLRSRLLVNGMKWFKHRATAKLTNMLVTNAPIPMIWTAALSKLKINY
jgi:hypothetical protein